MLMAVVFTLLIGRHYLLFLPQSTIIIRTTPSSFNILLSVFDAGMVGWLDRIWQMAVLQAFTNFTMCMGSFFLIFLHCTFLLFALAASSSFSYLHFCFSLLRVLVAMAFVSLPTCRLRGELCSTLSVDYIKSERKGCSSTHLFIECSETFQELLDGMKVRDFGTTYYKWPKQKLIYLFAF